MTSDIIDKLELIEFETLSIHLFVSFGLTQKQINEGLKNYGSKSKFKVAKDENSFHSNGDDFFIHFAIEDPNEVDNPNSWMTKEITISCTNVVFQLFRQLGTEINDNVENLFGYILGDIVHKVNALWEEVEMKLELLKFPNDLKRCRNPIDMNSEKTSEDVSKKNEKIAEEVTKLISSDPEGYKSLTNFLGWIKKD